jgi:hypothetical protein
MKVRYPKLGEACTAFYNEPGPKVTIGVVSVTELRAPEGIGPDVKTRPRRGTLHIEFERRNTPRTCLPGLLFEWDQNMARDCKLFQPLDINFVEDSKGLFAEVECTMVLVSPSNLLGGRRLLDQTRVSISVPVGVRGKLRSALAHWLFRFWPRKACNTQILMDLWDEGKCIAAAAAYDSDAPEVEEMIEEGGESDDDDEMVAEDEGLDSGWSDGESDDGSVASSHCSGRLDPAELSSDEDAAALEATVLDHEGGRGSAEVCCPRNSPLPPPF